MSVFGRESLTSLIETGYIISVIILNTVKFYILLKDGYITSRTHSSGEWKGEVDWITALLDLKLLFIHFCKILFWFYGEIRRINADWKQYCLPQKKEGSVVMFKWTQGGVECLVQWKLIVFSNCFSMWIIIKSFFRTNSRIPHRLLYFWWL